MPRMTKRVETAELQGAGSFVVLRGLPYGLVREAMLKLEAAPRDAQGNAQLSFQDNDEHLVKVLREAVVEWNWSDEAGQSLPTPAQGLAIAQLTLDEVSFLYRRAIGLDAERRNGDVKN